MIATGAETREETRAGFDLVMVRERDGWMCSVYRAGGRVPLARRLVPGRWERAAKWLDGMAASLTATRVGTEPLKNP
jgi:hypothetical protein